jgi:hypothetical protein
MKAPAIRGFRESRFHAAYDKRHDERGMTMALVAISMVAVIGIAALSIDVVTLLLAREEAQRAADAGALAAARMISISGLTSDPNNTSGVWACVCGTPGPTCGAGSGSPTPPALATAAANAAAGASTISGAGGNAAAFSVNVNYLQISSQPPNSATDCTSFIGKDGTFATNPMVTVQVTRTGLPTFFSRTWGYTGSTTSASATAEAFNPSYSASLSGGAITPVQPRCVKPWFVPNQDPMNPQPGPYCNNGTACKPLVGIGVSTYAQGQIVNPGISTDGKGDTGVVGETLTLIPGCSHANPNSCQLRGGEQPEANYQPPKNAILPNLEYVPGQVSGTPVAIPTTPISASGNPYQEAIGGCDQTTVYQCGVQSTAGSGPNFVDLNINPAQPTGSGYTTIGVMALIHQTSDDPTAPNGQDYFSPYETRSTAVPQILAGSSNPLGISGDQITASNSIVSLPIYDSTNNTIASNTTTAVTVVGFLQVFINNVDQNGNVNVSVMNVVGCGNGNGTTLNQAVTGSSPVPVRLVTPPSS